jgi:hypothetical protein
MRSSTIVDAVVASSSRRSNSKLQSRVARRNCGSLAILNGVQAGITDTSQNHLTCNAVFNDIVSSISTVAGEGTGDKDIACGCTSQSGAVYKDDFCNAIIVGIQSFYIDGQSQACNICIAGVSGHASVNFAGILHSLIELGVAVSIQTIVQSHIALFNLSNILCNGAGCSSQIVGAIRVHGVAVQTLNCIHVYFNKFCVFANLGNLYSGQLAVGGDRGCFSSINDLSRP